MGYDARNTEFGTKRTVVGAHYGLKDWLVQRVTAIILASYSIILLITFFLSGNNGFLRWSMIFQGFLGQDCDTVSDGGHLLPCLGWSEIFGWII